MNARRQGKPVPAATARTCRQCGRDLNGPDVPQTIAARIREVLEGAKPRPYDPAESEAQRQERTAEWDKQVSIHMRVTFGLLADALEGVCVFCSKVGQD